MSADKYLTGLQLIFAKFVQNRVRKKMKVDFS